MDYIATASVKGFCMDAGATYNGSGSPVVCGRATPYSLHN